MDKDLVALINDYETCLIDEIRAEQVFVGAQDAVEYEKARVVVLAYADGSIDGKTAEIRKWQETIFIGNAEGVHLLTEYWWEAKNNLDEVRAARKSLEAEIGLNKAFMYSKAGSLIKD